MDGTEFGAGGSRRWLLWLGLVLGGFVLVAWIDGGEEPVRPLSHEIVMPVKR